MSACSPSTSEEEAPEGPGIADMRLEGLMAEQPRQWKGTGENWVVMLTWSEPGVPVDHYVVSRNGSVIDNDVAGPGYRDRAIWPSEPYEYEVTAIDASWESSRPASVRIRTDAPPLAESRLVGDFDVRMTPMA